MNKVIYGDHDDATLSQFDKCLSFGSAHSGVLCADGHLGYAHPIGGVVGYTDHISLSGVGFDIACGNKAVRLDVTIDDLRKDIPSIMTEINKQVSFGVGRVNDTKVDHEVFDSRLWDHARVGNLKNLAREQLGTVGSGNHYVDVFVDENRYIWIGVHFGSRGLGHKITTKYMDEAGVTNQSMDADPVLLPVDSNIGQNYLSGVALAGQYAYAGRDWVVETVRQIIGGNVTFEVHNHHNFVWQETHFGQDMWVVRKGATPAFPGQFGFVGGSMGDNAYILSGIDSEESKNAMYSTVHGAGRIMSRTDARGKKNKKTGEVIREPRILRSDWKKWIDDFGVYVIGGDVDESPQAYRRLADVISCHKNTIQIHHTLTPIGVIMAGNDVKDPYKD